MTSRNFSRIGIIIVFGISGVGKTTACNDFISRHPHVLHTSAGALLRSVTGLPGDALRTAPSESIKENQVLLSQAFRDWRDGREDADVLIEAHSVIDNDHELVEVPLSVVRALQPTGLVLLEESPELIWRRRERDVRVRPARSIGDLREQTLAARGACSKYAEKLDLPLELGSLANSLKLDDMIYRVASQSRFNGDELRSKGFFL